VKELISKGELAPDALRWKMRRTRDQVESLRFAEARRRKADKLKQLREDGTEVNSDAEKTEDYLPAVSKGKSEGGEEVDTEGDRPYLVKKNGEPRCMPCRWTMSEHGILVNLLKNEGKIWKEIAEAIGTKNEQ
jgi:hypothetical protein